MTELEVFHFEEDKKSFDDFSYENGSKYWFASEFMKMLGYENFFSFKKAIVRAMTACTALNILTTDNFIEIKREINGQVEVDYKLTRFACYLTAMNGDVKKPQVAKAQAYFATIAESINNYLKEAENIERVLIRDDITDSEKSLGGIVKKAGIENYSYFQNAGYRGLYNMDLYKLKQYKRIPIKRSPLDFMGKEELAANLFRITQTEAKIKNEEIKGQINLEHAAEDVGRKVRKTIKETGGTLPEQLLPAEDINKVRSGIKETQKKFKKLDAPNNHKKRLP